MAIDFFAQIASIGGFLVGLVGVGLIVMNISRGQSWRTGSVMAVAGFIIGVLFFIIGEGLLLVGPTERVVVFNSVSGELEEARGPGIHVVIPGVQQTIRYDVSQQTYTMSGTDTEGNLRGDDAIRARSVDGQEVQVDLTVIFNIDPQNINTLHTNWPLQNYVDGLLRPTSRSIVRDVVALLAAEEIYGGSREIMQDRIASELTNQLVPQGIAVTSVLVRDINFSDAFIEAIEAKQVAEQELARAQTDAQRRTTEARAQADARIETARGEAEAIRVQAAAEADALRLVSEQIAANPNLIQYLYVTNLSDNVSVVLVPSNSPFLFDASTFTNLGTEFRAPEVPTQQPNN